MSFLIIYAILTVASSISSNVASSAIFGLLEPRIFKKKDLQEIKEALQYVSENLKVQGCTQESEELQRKIDEISEKTVEFYNSVHDDLTEIKSDLLSVVTQNADMKKENLEAVEELKRLILEYDLRKPYDIFTRDSGEFVVLLHPPFEIEPIERPELDELIAGQNIMIVGKPGIGKTLLLYQIAERQDIENIIWIKGYFSEIDINRLTREPLSERVLLVWDDIQNNAEVFYQAVGRLGDTVKSLRIICAVRSTEIDRIRKIPKVFLEECKFLRKEIPALDLEQRREIIRRCSKKTGIKITEKVTNVLAEKSDGTPLYIISVFLDEKYEKVGKILMGDIKSLPADVVDIWGKYFRDLASNEKAVLRYLMILSRVGVGGFKPLVEKLFMYGGDTYSALCDALDRLKEKLWLVVTEHSYECHDVQLEAVPFEDGTLRYLKEFASSSELNAYSRLLLYFGISGFHSEEISKSRIHERSMFHAMEAVGFAERSLSICKELGLRAELSMSLNDASNRYSDLSHFQQSREEKIKSLEAAVKYIEEAIGIYGELGLRAELSASLNNASNRYSDISYLQQTREEKIKSLEAAVKYIEEAIGIRRELGLRAELSMSLNNASNQYSDISHLQQTPEEKIKSLEAAVKYIEEAIGIYGELGLRAELSMSLNNASRSYSDLSHLQQTPEEKIKSLEAAVKYIEEAIGIRRELGLLLDLANSLAVSVIVYNSSIKFNPQLFSQAMKNCDEAIDIFLRFRLKEKYCTLLPFGIGYHQLMNTLARSPDHQIRISTYQRLLSNCSP